MVKLGYVSRAGPKENSNHVILGTQVRLRVVVWLGPLRCCVFVC
jgi:hypothetical protein